MKTIHYFCTTKIKEVITIKKTKLWDLKECIL